MVDKKLIQKLQKITKETYDKNLSFQEASEIADTLVKYFDLLGQLYHEIQNNE